MSIAIKREMMLEGSPWGRGFAVGLVLAMILLLPLFFVMALFGPFDRPASQEVVSRAPVTEVVRDWSAMTPEGNKDYLEN